MKNSLIKALASSVVLAGLAAPAQAYGLKAGESFGTGGIFFDTDVTATFDFGDSHGAYTSALKIFEVSANKSLTEAATLFSETKQSDKGSANGWLGTCGNTVLACNTEFTFKAGVQYTLGLHSLYKGSDKGTVYSTNNLNNKSTQQFIFDDAQLQFGSDTKAFQNLEAYQSADPFAGLVFSGIDDRGNGNDVDFQDVTFSVKAERVADASTPEPFSMIGAGLALGAGALLKNRKQ